MTPSAITPAARGTSTKRRSAKAARGASSERSNATAAAARPSNRAAPPAPKQRAKGHRSTVRKPTPPRRVSGPAGGRSAGTARAGTARAGTAPAGTAPTRAARRPPRRRARAVPRGSLFVRARVFVGGLPDHPLLDRIIRGRAWIPILGILLAGIVAMQVEVLKLSATTGRSIERGTALASRNEQLRASVAELSDDQRIERLAAGMGMVMPAPEAINFLDVRRGDAVHQALRNIHAPDASGFLAALPVIDTPAGAAAAAAGAATTPGASATLSPPAPTTTTTATTGVTPATSATSTSAASTTSTPTATPVGMASASTGG